MEEQRKNNRVRINLSQNSKGQIQIDCTAEFETVDESKKAAGKAFDAARDIIRERGLTEVGSV
jgi:hypothetical protein